MRSRSKGESGLHTRYAYFSNPRWRMLHALPTSDGPAPQFDP
ncbi:hypothetical protein CupriaWKF_23110 [Cupriavidus sp. WKF15]|nr:hypothetical protein [Cupriavidus sp. WKF15]WER49992.1 hypothetical protein CupriaWKF_23110 [Cupriavidus sp. WKF15]